MITYEGNVEVLTIAEVGELELSLEEWEILLEDESGEEGKQRIGVMDFAKQAIDRLLPDPEQEVEVVEVKVTKEDRMGVEADVFGRIPGGPSTPAVKPKKVLIHVK